MLSGLSAPSCKNKTVSELRKAVALRYSKLANVSVILAMLANTCFMQEAEKFFTCCARSCRLSFCLSRISCNRLFMSIIFYREIVPYTNIW